MVPPHLKEQAIDLQIHWVSETGKAPGLLTGGLKVIPTVSSIRNQLSTQPPNRPSQRQQAVNAR